MVAESIEKHYMENRGEFYLETVHTSTKTGKSIWSKFLEHYKSRQFKRKKDIEIIDQGDKTANCSSAAEDAQLYIDGIRQDAFVYGLLYGISLGELCTYLW